MKAGRKLVRLFLDRPKIKVVGPNLIIYTCAPIQTQMKHFLLLLILSLPLFSLGQLKNGHVEYDILLIDSEDNDTISDSWVFEVDFDQRFVRVNIQYENRGQMRIIDKQTGEVIIFSKEFNDSTFYCTTLKDMAAKDHSNTEPSNMHTTVRKSKKREKIVGYDCFLTSTSILESYNEQAWLSREIDCGVVIPETPLSFDKCALKYILRDHDNLLIYNASVVSMLSSPIKMEPMSGYKLAVPNEVFQQNEEEPQIVVVNHLVYPEYLNGSQELNDNFITYFDLKKSKLKDFEYDSASLSFEINENGIVNNILFDEEFEKISDLNKKRIIQFLDQSRFKAANVYGKTIVSKVKFQFRIPYE